ncbi:glutathione S-transferase family protein [Pseudomonas matsuisoli]|uniref:Glutathione S-transferase n=1 Tax=Pseudomonas matsuisoli TaxID=1515666 RepID=A0A917PTR6_9PSED|nr:glutathione S-transferase family protein [Pseudomonas matsuisoli]GGJ91181.1 glutathione S-transferase [Pseudomonas matsuisoli]
MRLYGDASSGNCYKVQLLLSLLDRPYEWVPVDILHGDTRAESFRAKNPNGKIPVLELDDGRTLWESNAILNFLAKGTALLPSDPWLHSKILQWQFFEQYSHEPYIAVARFINVYLGMPPERRDEFEQKRAGGYRALDVMERQLSQTPYLVGDTYSIADISLYAYTHVAEEGGFELSGYPAIQDWMARVADQPRHVPMPSRG